jgi:hypothetical protein
VARIYATLAANGRTVNLKLAPDEQGFKCLLAPDAFAGCAERVGQTGLDHGHAHEHKRNVAECDTGNGLTACRGQEIQQEKWAPDSLALEPIQKVVECVAGVQSVLWK